MIPILQLCCLFFPFHHHKIQFCLGYREAALTKPAEGAETLAMPNRPKTKHMGGYL